MARDIGPLLHPLIFVRGYAGTEGAIEEAVSDPYMGFNTGSTKLRQLWTGQVKRHYFESPLVRLMKEFGYRDAYVAGLDQLLDSDRAEKLPRQCVMIYRYYERASASFGEDRQVTVEEFAEDLGTLVETLRDRVDMGGRDPAEFRVNLAAHSMGGLIIRAFLQNDAIGKPATKALVDKVFTYATPHNGIEIEMLGNVPSFLSAGSANNFSRPRMREYLGLPKDAERVDSLDGKFDPDRFFCLVGTNSKDYPVGGGVVARAAGPFSDGLVRLYNAGVSGPPRNPGEPTRWAPRAFVHRSHSGPFGIVNSEEGYQNLRRFLFGNVRVDGVLDVTALTLPDEVEAMRAAGKQVRASYHFECISRVRGATWDLSRRVAAENSTVFRKYGELFPDFARDIDRKAHARPELFTAYLDADARVDSARPSLGFAVDVGVLVPDYVVDGVLWLKNHYAGGYLFRDKVNLEALPPTGKKGWRLRYGFDSRTPNATTAFADCTEADDHVEFRIPIVQKSRPGIEATLIISTRAWNT
ncbi:esterase/lipase family protein [Falsiroseomonas sp. HC035]|uniref:esterase/lipase family protein n=1 Tax=Falsiroseomonas sp. HC035 TaxID=3390999 RepID=UPI003D3228E6